MGENRIWAEDLMLEEYEKINKKGKKIKKPFFITKLNKFVLQQGRSLLLSVLLKQEYSHNFSYSLSNHLVKSSSFSTTEGQKGLLIQMLIQRL